ncbi:MAG: Ig-like domain-containing protein [Bacteroidales bacterium]|nr:Ig-like domain-containing protein [Bacteroidales bacterium]
MKKNRIINIILPLALIAIIASCAKQVAITGGPKDTTPPVMEKSTPANGSVNFIAERVYIEFDEYIKLNSLNQKLIISPPIEPAPDILIKGKGIMIKLDKANLQANTTYSFNFNDAIADNNENNSLHSFVYAFSTGNTIDSLSFAGQVVDAFTKEAFPDAWVVLYENMSDSAVRSVQPSYITKTDKEGKFLIPFVKENDFRIYAVKDNNSNYLFDLPDESIAFIDSVFRPGVEMIKMNDSSANKYRNYPEKIELLMFKENKQSQNIKSFKRLDKYSLEIVFNSTQYADYKLEIANDENAIIQAKQNPDTLLVYLKSEELINSDQFPVFCTYRDNIYPDSVKTDTLTFRRPEKTSIDSLAKLKINPIKEPHKSLVIKTDYPIAEFKSDKLKLELKSDSVFISAQITPVIDSLDPTKLILNGQILEKTDYRIILSDGFFTDIYGRPNSIDTLSFSSSSTSEYGNFTISLTSDKQNYIIQLLQSDKIIYEAYAIDGVVKFEYLKPGKYIVKAIEDQNNNLRWDTGELVKKLQPEPVVFMPVEYEIRSNWNHEIEWNTTTNSSR